MDSDVSLLLDSQSLSQFDACVPICPKYSFQFDDKLQAISPTVLQVDHQETVATDDSFHTEYAGNRDYGIEICSPSTSSDLFSFEVEANGIPDLPHAVDTSDFFDSDWLDTLGAPEGPIDLNQIRPMPLVDMHTPQPFVSMLPHASRGDDVATSSQHANPRRKSKFSVLPEQVEYCCRKDIEVCWPNGEVNRLHSYDDPFGDESSKPSLNNEDIRMGKPGQQLILSDEERKLLQQLHIQLPSRFPLSRAEEKALRIVRRKIRNKLSAQASRARRMEYVSTLERRLSIKDRENERLRLQVAQLENDKRDLSTHVQKLRSYLGKFLNQKDKSDSASLLPLFVRTNSMKRAKATSQAATAAGGTSLLIVTFMFLAWTARVPMKDSTGGHPLPPSLPAANPKSLLLQFSAQDAWNVFPGRSRFLQSANPDSNVDWNSKQEPPDKPFDASQPINKNFPDETESAQTVETDQHRASSNKPNRTNSFVISIPPPKKDEHLPNRNSVLNTKGNSMDL